VVRSGAHLVTVEQLVQATIAVEPVAKMWSTEKVIELRRIELRAAPPSKGMQLTTNSVTPFAKAKGAPLLLAADPRR
jgi:hypothetical protein